jgi:hypothetical protein
MTTTHAQGQRNSTLPRRGDSAQTRTSAIFGAIALTSQPAPHIARTGHQQVH